MGSNLLLWATVNGPSKVEDIFGVYSVEDAEVETEPITQYTMMPPNALILAIFLRKSVTNLHSKTKFSYH